MHIERVSQMLPFSCENIFDLAADVERYPEFLPWWISARVLEQDAGHLRVEQELGLGPARLRFRSDATLERPRRIDVGSTDAMFREFALAFTVAAEGGAACTLRIDARLQLRAFLMQLVVDRVLATAVDEMLKAFERRAHRICGTA
jgi:coenzyme Q-binding protein COQ10